MTAASWAAVAGAVVVATATWVFMFRLDRSHMWPRTWAAAGVVSCYAVAAALALGDARKLLGRISFVELLVGIAVGGAWLATHLGAAALGRIVPSFLAEISDLYRLAGGTRDLRSSVVSLSPYDEVWLIIGRRCARVGSPMQRSLSWRTCATSPCGIRASGMSAWSLVRLPDSVRRSMSPYVFRGAR